MWSICTIRFQKVVAFKLFKHLFYIQVEEAERRVAEVSYIKNYSKEYFSSKSDESKIKAFELEHPRYSKLIEGNNLFQSLNTLGVTTF